MFVLLVGWTFLSGVFEMGGMMAILGFISGLTEKGEGHHRSGAIGKVTEVVMGGPVDQTTYVVFAGGGLLLFIIFKNLQSMSAQFLMNQFLMRRNLVLSKELFEGYLAAPYVELQPRTVGSVQKKINEIFSVFSASFTSTAQVIADGLTLAMVVLLLLYINPILTVVAAGMFGGIGTLIYWSLQRALKSMGREESEARNNASKFLEQAFVGIIDTRLRDLRNYFVRHYTRAITRTSVIKRRKLALDKLPRSTNEILLTTMIVCSVLYLSLTGGSLTDALPTLAVFGFAGLRMTGSMSRLNNNMQRLRQGNERMLKLTRVLRTVTQSFTREEDQDRIGRYTDLELEASAGPEMHREWTLQLSDVQFRYPGSSKDVVKNISLTISRGQFVSFCGPSGGGKSTLVLLLMGLLVPTRGRIECDDKNIFHHIRTWHKNIAYVGQNIFLTDESVRLNVAFGIPEQDIDDGQVERALRRACAYDFVNALPQGADTPLRGGEILSGGQKQRIVIARALYHDPEILVFDEATAALDNETERDITMAVQELSASKTVICVAHRLSTIRASDTIHFMAKGKILASGTYDALLEECPEFRAMVEAGALNDGEI